MAAGTILNIDKIFFSIFAIYSKLVKLEPYITISLFYDRNLKGTVTKIPTFFDFFFYRNSFPGQCLSRAV